MKTLIKILLYIIGLFKKQVKESVILAKIKKVKKLYVLRFKEIEHDSCENNIYLNGGFL